MECWETGARRFRIVAETQTGLFGAGDSIPNSRALGSLSRLEPPDKKHRRNKSAHENRIESPQLGETQPGVNPPCQKREQKACSR